MKYTNRLLRWLVGSILACTVCLVGMSGGPGLAQYEGDKYAAPIFIKAGTITFALCDTTLKLMILDSTAAWADSALKLKSGVIVRAHFQSGFLDSIRYFIVDTATWSRYVRTGGITSRRPFSAAAWDSLLNYWILTAQYAATAGTASNAVEAEHAKDADNATTTDQDTIPFSWHSLTSHYADIAGTTIDTTFVWEIDSALWAEIMDSVDAHISSSDSALYADTSGITKGLFTGALDAITEISSGVRAAYIPTANQKAALAKPTYGEEFTGANKAVDSTGLRNLAIVKNSAIKNFRIHFNLGGTNVCEGSGNLYTLGIDTTDGGAQVLRWQASLDKYGAWIDSAYTTDVMKGLFPLKGTGYEPTTIWVIGAAGAPGGTLQDVWFDTTLQVTKVKLAAGWTTFGGAGGGADSVAKSVLLHLHGSAPLLLDADSLAMLSRADTFEQDVTLSGAADLLAGDATTNIGTKALPIDTLHVGAVAVDSLCGRGSGGVLDSIYVRSTTHFDPSSTIGEPTWAKSPGWIFADGISLDTTHGTNLQAKGIGYFGQLLPYATSTIKRLGYRTSNAHALDPTLWREINTAKFSAMDCVMVWDTGSGYSVGTANNYTLIRPRSGIKVVGDDILVQSGNFTLQGGQFWTQSDASVFLDGTQIQFNARPHFTTKYVTVDEGGGDWHNSYWVRPDQRSGLDSACNPSATNALITKSAMKHGMMGAVGEWTDLFGLDSLAENWFKLYSYMLRHLPNSCWDSSYAPAVMSAMVTTHIIPSVYDPSYYWPTMFINTDTGDTGGQGRPRTIMHTPPSTHNEYIVNQAYNDTLGGVTGYFSTIQAALDSIPNYHCKAGAHTQQGSRDTIFFIPSNGGLYLPRLYLGSVPKDTLDGFPDNITESGVWLRVSGATSAVGRVWTSVTEWINDSTCIVADTQVTRASPSNVNLVIAKPWTVTIEPARDGNTWIGDSIRIMHYAPITIRGRGADLTLLSSGVAKAVAGQSNCLFYTPTDSCFGMPITISDMSLFSFPNTAPNTAALLIHGARLTLRNIKSVVKAVADYSVPFVEYHGSSSWTDDEHLILADHVTVAVDSDCYVYRIKTLGCEMESRNSVYSIGGSTCAILSCGQDMVLGAQFWQDQFYMNPAADTGSFFQSDVAQTDSITASYCRATGLAPVGGFLPDANWNSVFTENCSNIDQTANIGMTKPPVEVRDAMFMLQTKVPVK